jgi:hypothetical protein
MTWHGLAENPMRNTIHLSLSLLAVVLAANALGCAFGELRPNDPYQRQLKLEEIHKDYSDSVRWSKFEEASKYVVTEEQSDFVRSMPDFKEVRFTDWKAEPFELDEEMRNATIDVEYTGYSMVSPFEITVHEKQEWTRVGKGNNWKVKSSFEDLHKLAGK